jgi:hypothetical protein
MSEATSFREHFAKAAVLIRKGHPQQAIPILDRLIASDSSCCLTLRERGLAKKKASVEADRGRRPGFSGFSASSVTVCIVALGRESFQ